jgi:hypothetical protein
VQHANGQLVTEGSGHAHHPMVPGAPLKGPSTLAVTQPP